MNANDVIESYVADVIRRVPLKERNDIGFELHTLLTEMLDERAQEAGKPADDAMVLAMLREFGAPADIAARYRAPGFVIIPPEQTRSFAWLSLSGIARRSRDPSPNAPSRPPRLPPRPPSPRCSTSSAIPVG